MKDFGNRESGRFSKKEEMPDFSVETVSDERRGSTELNEDRFIAKENQQTIIAGVFDGATLVDDIGYFRELGKTPGRVVAEIAINAIENLGNDLDINPAELMIKINEDIREAAVYLPLEEDVKLECFSAGGVIAGIDKEKRIMRFAALGDCLLLAFQNDVFEWCIEDRIAPYEAEEIKALLRVVRRENILPKDALEHPEVVTAIKKNRKLRENHPSGKGYGVLKGNSNEIVKKYIQAGVIKIKLEGGAKIFLLTDGMLPPAPTKKEQKTLVEKALRGGGINRLLSLTRSIQDGDPNLTLPRLKQYDDATAVEIKGKIDKN